MCHEQNRRSDKCQLLNVPKLPTLNITYFRKLPDRAEKQNRNGIKVNSLRVMEKIDSDLGSAICLVVEFYFMIGSQSVRLIVWFSLGELIALSDFCVM